MMKAGLLVVLALCAASATGARTRVPGCPVECDCVGSIGECSRLPLSSPLPSHLTTLHVRQPKAPLELVADVFKEHARSLKHIIIEEATISRFDADAFRGLERAVEMITFTECQFMNEVRVPALAFERLFALSKLMILRTPLPGGEIRLASASLRDLFLIECGLQHVDANSFVDTPNLEHLYLKDNQILNVSRDVFAALDVLETLDLSNNSLTKVPADAFRDMDELDTLDLSHNALTDGIAWPLNRELEKLLLAECALSEFEPRGSLPQLVHLDLRGNKITALPADLFSAMPDLEYANFADNRLTALPPLTQNARLDELHLDGNAWSGGVMPLGGAASAAWMALRELSCARCGLRSLNPAVLAAMPALTVLRLPHNAFETLPSGAFDGAAALVEVDLSDTGLLELDAATFAPLTGLRRLALGENHMLDVPTSLFRANAHLARLNITGNRLARVRFELNTLPQLRELYAAHTGLRALTALDLSTMPTLLRLDIDGIAFECDDVFLTMVRALKRRYVRNVGASGLEESASGDVDSFRNWNVLQKSVCPTGPAIKAPAMDGDHSTQIDGDQSTHMDGDDIDDYEGDEDGFDDDDDDEEEDDEDLSDEDEDDEGNANNVHTIKSDAKFILTLERTHMNAESVFGAVGGEHSFLVIAFVFLFTALLVLFVVTNLVLLLLRRWRRLRSAASAPAPGDGGPTTVSSLFGRIASRNVASRYFTVPGGVGGGDSAKAGLMDSCDSVYRPLTEDIHAPPAALLHVASPFGRYQPLATQPDEPHA